MDRSTDWPSLTIEFHAYWKEVHDEDLNKIVNVDLPNGSRGSVNLLDLEMKYYLETERCKFRIAEHNGKIVGFMIYNLVFDAVLICRAVYFTPEFRKAKLLRSIMLGVGPVRKIYSQTHTQKQPKEIQGEKKTRKKIYSNGKFDLWENTIRENGFYQNQFKGESWDQAGDGLHSAVQHSEPKQNQKKDQLSKSLRTTQTQRSGEWTKSSQTRKRSEPVDLLGRDVIPLEPLS